MKRELEKIYDPSDIEKKLYEKWMDKGYFAAHVDKNKKPFTIIMPPPNVTGNLHIGHALTYTTQDILTRFKRMQGYSALFLPGTDHSAIATEVKVVEALRAEGLSKEDLGYEGFLERTWAWSNKYGGNIINQQKRLGISADWDRQTFTMDEGVSRSVRTVFSKLYKKGLIYHGDRIINWCPSCLTTISDAEVEFEESEDRLWHLRYPLEDGSGEICIATTRPETIFGDTAVAANPEDERYKDMIGKKVRLPLTDRLIPIIADDYVDKDFGTGVLKITPANDIADFEVGKRHNLEIINTLNEDGTMNENAPLIAGLDRFVAREKTSDLLEEAGFIVKKEPYTHNVGTCYRCHTIIEPRISLQWFVKMEELAAPAIEVVKTGETKFVPERFEKTYFHWMENIKDWCISRQIWWGHRIPVWYCDDCKHETVSVDTPEACEKCKSENITQDKDTLDTWFSSALWPFSTLGWPDDTDDLNYFYPTDVLVTAYDIIFFWVARMIFSGIEQTGKTPFHTVLMHGLVRDNLGRKMSKSLGNGIDPLLMVDQYGADALRFSLINGNTPGNDIRFSEDRVILGRNFLNKIWNAARFIMMNLEENSFSGLPSELLIEDRWILSKLNDLIKEVTDNLENFDVGIAAAKIYEFVWDVYCDWYIEICKTRLNSGGERAQNAGQILVYVMSEFLKLLHPIMPFISEEIYSAILGTDESIMVAKWPIYREELHMPEDEASFEKIMDVVKAVRNIRAEMNVPHGRKAKLFIETSEKTLFEEGSGFLSRLASASEVEVAKLPDMPGAITLVTESARILIPMEDLIDIEKETLRLKKEEEKTLKDISIISGKLTNDGFLAKAPESLINEEEQRLVNAKEKLAKINESLNSLK